MAGAPLALFETPVTSGVWPNTVSPTVRKSGVAGLRGERPGAHLGWALISSIRQVSPSIVK